MRVKLLLSGLLIIGYCALTSSCQRDDLLYSCDPGIDQWTKANISEIQKMTKINFLSYSNNTNLQKGIYAAMSKEQKKQIWKGKIETVLLLPWNEKERNHIESLLDIINDRSYLFDPMSYNNDADEIDLITYNWINYAKEELRWDYEIYAIAMTPNNVYKSDSRIIVDEDFGNKIPSILTRSEEVEYACNCTNNLGCPTDFKCYDHPCRVVNTCGLLGLSPCSGMCGKLHLK